MHLSACLIVRDEEDRLPVALDSLRGVADEVCVLDTHFGGEPPAR